jgi:hypothetical protein
MSLLDLDAFRARLAMERAERELWARLDRRAAALAWWIASHPRPSAEDWHDLATDPDLEDANAGFQTLIGLSSVSEAIEFVTVTFWTRGGDGAA